MHRSATILKGDLGKEFRRMFATVTTWRLAPSVQGADVQDQFLREMTTGAIGIVRERGVLDVVMIMIEPDRLLVVSSYETLDEALSSGPPLLKYLTDRFSDRIELISRSTGPVFEPSHFAINPSDARQWRDEAQAMYANISISRIDPSIRDPDELTSFLTAIADEFMTLLSRLGLLDFMVVRISDDTLLSLRLFEDPEAFDAAMQHARQQVPSDLLAGKLEPVEQFRGRAFDSTQLLSK